MKFYRPVSRGICAVLWALVLVLVVCSAARVGQEKRNDYRAAQIDEPKSFKLFDFNNFKSVFHKKYRSILEEAFRMRIFWAKCFKSYISLIKFKLNQSTSYRWINHMSDWTREEWERTLMGPLKRPHVVGGTTYDEVESQKESLSEQQRDLSATSAGTGAADVAESVSIPTGRHRQSAPMSQKVAPDQIARRRDHNPTSAWRPVTRAVGNADRDENYNVDHRQCFNEIREQKDCGSCYVFTAISVLECHYYKATGKRISFSEQYALDCGEATCTGGYPLDIIDFSSEYGIDLAENIPYFARARRCTFGKPIRDREAAGFYHVTGLSYRMVSLDELQEEIVNGPIVFIVSVNDEFDGYRRGIDDLKGCIKNKYNHAMVLVGYGQENGTDFWLARNSYSDKWGENGHYRISQEALERCSLDEFALVEADNVRFKKNRHYDLERLQRLKKNWVGTDENKE